MTEIMLEHAPKEWASKRPSQFFRRRKEKVSDRDLPPLSVTKNGIVPQLETAAKTDVSDLVILSSTAGLTARAPVGFPNWRGLSHSSIWFWSLATFTRVSPTTLLARPKLSRGLEYSGVGIRDEERR